jgi:biopolymer transport protein ExbD
MARHKKRRPYEDDPPKLEISSLIDICFLLLIYFLVTSTLIPRETDLDMRLPAQVQSDSQPDIEPLFIRVDANGTIFSGTGAAQQALDSNEADRNVPLLAAQLELYATAARSGGSTPLVQIYADGNASQQRVIDVLNALARVSITSVTFTDLLDAP